MYRIRTIVLTLTSGLVVVALSAGPAAADAVDASTDLGAGVSGAEMATDALCGSLDVTADGRCDEDDAGALGAGGARPGGSWGPEPDEDPTPSLPDPCGEEAQPGRGLPRGVADGPFSGGDLERQFNETADTVENLGDSLLIAAGLFGSVGLKPVAAAAAAGGAALKWAAREHREVLDEAGATDSTDSADSSTDADDRGGEEEEDATEGEGNEVDDSWLGGGEDDGNGGGDAGEEAGQPAFGEEPCTGLGSDDPQSSDWVTHYLETGDNPTDFNGDFDCDSPAEGQAQDEAPAGDENQGCPNDPDKSHQTEPPCGAEPGHGTDTGNLADCIGEFDDDGCSSEVQPSVAPCDGLRLPGGGSGGGADVGELETPIDDIVDPCINAYCDGETGAESTSATNGSQAQTGIDTGLAVELVSPQLDEVPVSIVMDLGAVDGPAPGSW